MIKHGLLENSSFHGAPNYTSRFTVRALYKNSLYQKMRGCFFAAYMFCGMYPAWYIYICKWKLRNWGTLKFKRLRNLDVCERAPLRPCPMFLTMKRIEKVYKDSIWSGKWSQPPLQPNTRQDELCTTTAWLGMISKGGGPTQIRITTWSPRPDTSQTPARLTLGHLYPWLLLPWLALPWLALPCLACAALCRGNVTE